MKLSARLLVITLVVVLAFGMVAEASGLVLESTYKKKGLEKFNGYLNEWYIGTPADMADIVQMNTNNTSVDIEGFIFSMWDDNYLYFGGEIYDDAVQFHDWEWGQDRMSFLINTRPGGTKAEEIANLEGAKMLPGHQMFGYRVFFAEFGGDGVQAATVPIDGGYSFEVRIPWSKIQFGNYEKPGVGLEFGLSILITDWKAEWKDAPEAVWGADWSEGLWQWNKMGTLRLIDTPKED